MTKPYHSVKQYRFTPNTELLDVKMAMATALLMVPPDSLLSRLIKSPETDILGTHRERRIAERDGNSLPGLIYIPPHDELNELFMADRKPGEMRWQCSRCRRLLTGAATSISCGCHVGA